MNIVFISNVLYGNIRIIHDTVSIKCRKLTFIIIVTILVKLTFMLCMFVNIPFLCVTCTMQCLQI